MFNQNIIDNLKKLVQLIQLETNNLTDKKEITVNQFRLANLKKVIKIISKFNFEIKDPTQLKDIKGIGKGTIMRVEEILKTGKLDELKNYNKVVKKLSVNEDIINDLMNVIGIGRVMAKDLIDKYKIKSVDELKKLSDSGKIELNDKIKLGLKYVGKFQGSIPRSEIDKIYDYLQKLTDKYNPNMFITICGSYRRELPISSDIDVLLSSLDIISMDDIVLGGNHLSDYVNFLHKEGFLIDDLTDKNIKTKYMGFGKYNGPIRRVDIRLIPMISYFPALLYFTGSYEFNQEMRQKAKKLGYKLNEYGLYNIKTDEMIIVTSEQDMFNKLQMKYLSPEER